MSMAAECQREQSTLMFDGALVLYAGFVGIPMLLCDLVRLFTIVLFVVEFLSLLVGVDWLLGFV